MVGFEILGPRAHFRYANYSQKLKKERRQLDAKSSFPNRGNSVMVHDHTSDLLLLKLLKYQILITTKVRDRMGFNIFNCDLNVCVYICIYF